MSRASQVRILPPQRKIKKSLLRCFYFVNYYMKKLFIISTILFLFSCDSKSANKIELQKENITTINQVVEAACGQCQFGMTEELGCDLAVRIDGKTYFVDGTNIHEHGDAHANDGFCEIIRHASVKGKIINGRFNSESFTLIK